MIEEPVDIKVQAAEYIHDGVGFIIEGTVEDEHRFEDNKFASSLTSWNQQAMELIENMNEAQEDPEIGKVLTPNGVVIMAGDETNDVE